MIRHGRSMRSRRPVTHNIQTPDLRRRTATQHAGTRVARAQSVDERIVTMRALVSGRKRKHGYPSRRGGSSLPPSMTASPSGR
jgi:hypothetical protein